MTEARSQAEIAASRSIQRDFRKPIWRKFISAVKTYGLIQPGDHVAVCVSGGRIPWRWRFACGS